MYESETDSELTLIRLCRDPHATAPPTTSSTNQRRYMTGEESKQAEGCMTIVFPVGGVLVVSVIGRFATLPRKARHTDGTASCTPAHVLIGHPFIRFLQKDFVRPLSGFDSSHVGGAARSLPVADVITLPIGHAADQLPVVFLVGTLKLKMSTTDQCFPAVQ